MGSVNGKYGLIKNIEKYGLNQVGSVDGNIFAYINSKRKYIGSISDLGKF